MGSKKRLVCPPPGTEINGCTVIEEIDRCRVLMRCRCGTEFKPQRTVVIHRTVRSCGCYQKKLHCMIMRQAFHFRGKGKQAAN